MPVKKFVQFIVVCILFIYLFIYLDPFFLWFCKRSASIMFVITARLD